MASEHQMDDLRRIALASEELSVSKQIVEGDTLRVHVETTPEARSVELNNAREDIRIETVDIGREISEMPSIRVEGNVTIIPVVEEEAVIVKRLILKQEVRLTRIRTEVTVAQTVTLRSQKAIVERISPSIPHPLESKND